MRRIIPAAMLSLCAATAWAENFSVEFNGTNSTVAVGSSTGLNPTGPFTLEAWVKPDTLASRHDVVYKWSAGGYANQRSWFLQIVDATAEFALSTTGQSESVRAILSTDTLTMGEWSHIAGVFDGSEMRLYVDGILQGQTESVTGHALAGNSPVVIGGTASSTYEPFDGCIDEVRISDVARYTDDFTLQAAPFTPDEHTLLLMHMDEGTGSTAANLGLQAGSGTLKNGATWAAGAPVPEPATLLMMTSGLLAGAGVLRRRRTTRR